jgi:hypothetical protein
LPEQKYGRRGRAEPVDQGEKRGSVIQVLILYVFTVVSAIL